MWKVAPEKKRKKLACLYCWMRIERANGQVHNLNVYLSGRLRPQAKNLGPKKSGFVNLTVLYLTLKTRIRDKWVYSMQTNRFHLVTLYCWMRIEWANRESAQIKYLSSRLRPQAGFAYPMNPLYSHSAKWQHGKELGSHHWNPSLHAADSLTIASL